LRYRDTAELKRALEIFLMPSRAHADNSTLMANTLSIVFLFMAVICIYQFYSAPLAPAPVPVRSQGLRVPVALPALGPVDGQAGGNATVFTGRKTLPLSQQEMSQLGKYDVAILLDRSASMTVQFDCPLADIMTSRWDWANRQLQAFSRETESCLPNGF